MRFSHVIILVLVASLAACADDKVGSFLVAPDTYTLYRCDDLAIALKERAERKNQLEALMARAGTGAGSLVSDVAYRPEYDQVLAQIREVRRTAAEKHCNLPPEAAPLRASDESIH